VLRNEGIRSVAAALVIALAVAGQARAQESRSAKHYRERMEKFVEENKTLAKDARPVVFVGDSITEGFPLGRHLAGIATLNRGIGSDRVGLGLQRGVLHRLDESVFLGLPDGARPSAVFLLIGVNDLASSSKPAEHWVPGIEAIVDGIRAKLPDVPIVLHTLLPTGTSYGRHVELNPKIARMNEGIRELARARRLPLIDLHALYKDADGLLPAEMTGDGLHLKAAAYARWAEAARALLERR
jgi:lysophospholipase L1-like esterase